MIRARQFDPKSVVARRDRGVARRRLSTNVARVFWCGSLMWCALVSVSLNATERGDDNNPAHWLQRMNHAFANESYDGVFTILRGARMSSLRVLHAVIDGVPHDRLMHLDGTAREIIRVGDALTCVLMPGDELAGLSAGVPSGPLAVTFARDFSAVSAQYRLRLGGAGRIAGRKVRQLSIQPLDADRYGYELWLDESTGLLLKSELRDGSRMPLEVFQFSQLQIGAALPAREFVAPAQARQIVITEPQTAAPDLHRSSAHAAGNTAASPAGRSSWSVGWLPAGFMMAASDVRRSARSADALSTLMYGDGLAAFSVFIEAMPKTAQPSADARVMHEGATVAMSRDLRDGAGKAFLITVVGEVPDATAARVLRSVQHAP